MDIFSHITKKEMPKLTRQKVYQMPFNLGSGNISVLVHSSWLLIQGVLQAKKKSNINVPIN